MNVTEFLHEIKKEQLTGREFLALIGHTEISNEDYSEIKNNPSMPYSRLVEILKNAPITSEDYKSLIKTARYRKEQQLQKKKREEMVSHLAAILSAPPDRTASEQASPEQASPKQVSPEQTASVHTASVAIVDSTEEINIDVITTFVDDAIDADDDVLEYTASAVEELWGEPSGFEIDSVSNCDIDNDEYGDINDFDKSARRENLPKIIICLTMSVALIFSSFFIRYATTGSWDVSGFAHKTPQSYEEIFELQSSKPSRNRATTSSATALSGLYRAENHTQSRNPLSLVASNRNYLFKATDDFVYSVKIDSGAMKKAPAFTPDIEKILGLFEQNNRLYVIASQPQNISVYEFNALDFTGVPDAHHRFSGRFREVILNNNGFFIIGDYQPNTTKPAENADCIPTYGENLIDIKNIEFIKDARYSNMTVIASVSKEGLELYAVAGNLAECVYYGDNSLIMSFYNSDSAKKNESRLLRYNVFGSVLSNPTWGSVRGRISQGFISETAGITRVVSDAGGSATLHVLNSNMNSIGRSGVVSTEDGINGVAFDSKTAYIIAAQANLPEKVFAIDTTNTNRPVFINEPNALISDKEFYPWGENRFFSVDVDIDNNGNRRGILVTMYYQLPDSSAPPKAESSYRLVLNDATWHEYTQTSAELFREAVAANKESGIIIIPVTYFNAVTRVESFYGLEYAEGDGGNTFSEIGKIIEMGTNTKLHAAIIQSGYVYTFWDNVVRSAATDLTVISIHELNP